jgi:hypothetical protein
VSEISEQSLSGPTDFLHEFMTSLLTVEMHIGEISRLGCQTFLMGRFNVIPISAISFSLQSPGFIPAPSMTFISLLGQFSLPIRSCMKVCLCPGAPQTKAKEKNFSRHESSE